MALIKYNPNRYRPTTFSSLLDNFFDDRFQGGSREVDYTPTVDISETEKAFEIQLAIPGVKKSDVNISVENDQLTISGERNIENESNEKNFHTRESFSGTFSRSFTLPEIVNVDKIDAKQEDGILYIVLPKDEKKTAKKLIKVG
ncbi:MAG: Hsp20/alpha crystallin family protein [Cytophagales bacterium]|nr:Hsp20/alpha crystallin family protein [Cytophagales bacterium]